MKSFLLVAILAISCAFAKDVTSIEVPTKTCYQSCTGFADYLKNRKVVDPLEEAKKFCAAAKIQCTDVTRFAKFVNTYVQANFSVKWICRSKKFCAESKSTNSGGLCAGCKAIVRMISSLIKTANETETEIIDAVKNLCKILSPLEIQAKVCKDVLDYIQKIIQLVLAGLQPGDICIKLKLCNSTIGMQPNEIVKQIAEVIPFVSRKIIEAQKDLPYVMNRFNKMEKKSTNVRGPRTCEICKTVTNIVSYTMQFTNSTIKTIGETIKTFCSLKPEIQRIECLDLLEKANEIAQYLEQKLSPAEACQKLRMCPGRARFALQPVKWAIAIGNKMTKKESKVSCTICKTVVDIVAYSIRFTNSTIQSIEESVRAFCNMKPEIEKKMCLMYVSRIDDIVQYIEQKLLPGEVCVKLGICTKTGDMRYTTFRRPSRKHQRRLKSVCKACSRYEKFIEEHLKVYKSSSQKMRGLIAANCADWASSAMEEKCLMIAPALVTTDGIANKLLDKSICKKNLCSQAFMISSNIIYKKKSDACDLCKYGLGSLLKKFESYRQALKGHFTKSGNFCSNSNFKELSAECKLFVNRTETLFEDVYKQIESAEVCNRMRLCRQKSMFSFEQFLGSLSGDSKACEVCKSVVEATQKGTSVIGGSKSLSTACQGVKSSVGRMVCNKILGNAGALAGQKEAGKSPEDVCKQFQLCGNGDSIGGIISGVFKGLQDIFG